MSESKALETTSPNRSGNGYRYDHFHAGIALRDFVFSRDSLGPGDRLPDMILVETTRFAAFAARRPVKGKSEDRGGADQLGSRRLPIHQHGDVE